MASWLRAKVDEKPWWTLIAVAALGALGAQLIEAVPAAVKLVASCFPQETMIQVHIRHEDGTTLVNGAEVSVIDEHQRAVDLADVEGNSVKTLRGLATVRPVARPGRGYAVILTYRYDDRTYRYTVPTQLKADEQISVLFPENWDIGDNPPEGVAVASSQVVSASGAPEWLQFAYAELGQAEIPGPANNPRILAYLASVPNDLQRWGEETPWSSAFVEYVLAKASIRGAGSLRNQDWSSWGKVMSSPIPGCVAVFWRESPNSGFGHVGFFMGEERGSMLILGGNQSNKVSIAALDPARFLGCRWPV